MIIGEDKPSLDELFHRGVKGMRWGVRGAHLEKVRKTTEVLDKVAAGKGTTRQKLGVAVSSSAASLASKGIKGSAAAKSQQLKDHAERVAKGKATIRDGLMIYGNVSVLDLRKAASRRPQ